MQAAQTDTMTFDAWAKTMQARCEKTLDANLPTEEASPATLHQAMRYAVMGGGKRVRALLTYAAAEFCSAEPEVADIPAAAVEMIHAYSLVHDDMPCMDDDDLRRGKPATHKQFGESMGLLAGDALQSMAFQWLSQESDVRDAQQKIKMLHILSFASGSRGMAGGQAIDLQSVGLSLTRNELEHMHIQKTGALIRAAALMGVYCANKPDEDKLTAVDHFSKAIGLAFQVVDDILDAEGDTQTLGKTAGKDAQFHKSTYVTILGLEKAKVLANELHDNAMAALSYFGPEADLLRALADLILQRSH